jgi:hypothetical protein
MTMSAQHRDWLARGGQWRCCTPGAMLRDTLRAAGYTVYDLGNDAHLDHQPPEDHCPYSETNWPGGQVYGVVMAIDIMPPPRGSGLPSLQVLGAKLHADKMSGAYPPIKYMNWGPLTDSSAVQCRWKPNHVQGSSSDTGHIHISFRTDYVDYATPYNPLGDEMELTDPVGNTQTPAGPHNAAGQPVARSVEQTLGDVFNDVHGVGRGEIKPTDPRYPPSGTPARAALEMPGNVQTIASMQSNHTAMLDSIQEAVDAIVITPLSQDAVNAAVKLALTDPAVIGPLVKAINDDAARRAAD